MDSFWYEILDSQAIKKNPITIPGDPNAWELNYLRKQKTVFDYIEYRPTEIDNFRMISLGNPPNCVNIQSSSQVLRSVDLQYHYLALLDANYWKKNQISHR